MKAGLSFDDLALFLAVADAGGLAGAAAQTGASLPTLSRRMAELERATGRHLFARGRQRYALTTDGRALLAEAEALRQVRAQIERWRHEGRATPRVRITAGLWTTRLLARCVTRDWSADADWVPEFMASNANVDIARREADIGIRNRRPEQSWLAGRQTVPVRFAVYAAGPEVQGYLTLSESTPTTPSERWLRNHHGGEIVTRASDARVALDLARAGVGRIVMPCFAGDAEPGLARLTGPIEELTHVEWLVAHHDARHDPPVRHALDALHRFLVSVER